MSNSDASPRQDTKNCQFISRFVTRPWEHGQRMLTFYNFETGEIETQSSMSLFARDGLNTQDVEGWLNKRRDIKPPIRSAR